MFTVRTMTDRLVKLYNDATDECRSRADWYADVAGRDVERIATETDLPFSTVAAVLAVTSPGPTYAQNVKDARALCKWSVGGEKGPAPTCATYGANVRKAVEILRSGELSLVTGPKVTAFYRNIMGDWSHVTLDRHAVRPIQKSPRDLDWRKGNTSHTPNSREERKRMVEAYTRAAHRVGIEPAQFQAVVWCVVRGAES